ncbi:MAG: 30S ribosomal protein S7 [Candidatus Micrarchaeota archaeon]|nr:30S ribosomal protein S7 [Candidatus Micrarchaeota archaeon]
MADEVQQVVQETAEAATAEKPKRRAARPAAKKASPAEEGPIQQNDTMLFGKYSFAVKISDPSLRNYINLKPVAYPMSFRRTSQKKFSKAEMSVIERLENSLMRGGTGGKIGGRVIRTKGRLQGKKLKTIKIIEDAFDSIHRQTGANPIQIFVRALEYSAPIDDTTRVRYGGIISNVAVDVSASRRMDIALRNIALAALIGGFGTKRSVADTLASELILASRNDVNSYSIKRKNEIERMARSAK